MGPDEGPRCSFDVDVWLCFLLARRALKSRPPLLIRRRGLRIGVCAHFSVHGVKVWLCFRLARGPSRKGPRCSFTSRCRIELALFPVRGLVVFPAGAVGPQGKAPVAHCRRGACIGVRCRRGASFLSSASFVADSSPKHAMVSWCASRLFRRLCRDGADTHRAYEHIDPTGWI